MAEIERLEGAAAQLFEMCVAAGDHVVDNDLVHRMRIPPMARPAIRRTWESEPPRLYGPFDLRYDGGCPPHRRESHPGPPAGPAGAPGQQSGWDQPAGPGDHPRHAPPPR